MNDEVKMMNDEDLAFVVGGANGGTYTADLGKFIQHAKGMGGREDDRFFITFGGMGKTNRPENDKGFASILRLAEQHGSVTFHAADGSSQTFTADQLKKMF